MSRSAQQRPRRVVELARRDRALRRPTIREHYLLGLGERFGTDGGAGNLVDDGLRLSEWDALNRLKRVKRKSDGAVIAEYTYDALGRRVRKVISNNGLSGNITNATIDFVYDTQRRVIEERQDISSTDTPTKQYVWGNGYIHDLCQVKLLVAENNFAANDELYPMQDLLWRTQCLGDSSGVIREAYDYDAYGNTLIFRKTGTPPGEITFLDNDTQVEEPTNPYLYTGQRWDAEIQWYHDDARPYGPTTGRFASRDPLGDSNPYRYVSCNPTRWLDPSGLAVVEYDVSNCYDPTCGPDVTEWFVQQLETVRQFTAALTPWDEDLRTMFVELKFERSNLGKPPSSVHCPSSVACAGTVTLCGTCIDVTELGNLAFGYAAADRLEFILWGGIYAEVKGRGFDTPVEVASALIGYQFRQSGGDLCQVLSSPAPHTAGFIPNRRIAQLNWVYERMTGENILAAWMADHFDAAGDIGPLSAIEFLQVSAAMLTSQRGGYLQIAETRGCASCSEVYDGQSVRISTEAVVTWE